MVEAEDPGTLEQPEVSGVILEILREANLIAREGGTPAQRVVFFLRKQRLLTRLRREVDEDPPAQS